MGAQAAAHAPLPSTSLHACRSALLYDSADTSPLPIKEGSSFHGKTGIKSPLRGIHTEGSYIICAREQCTDRRGSDASDQYIQSSHSFRLFLHAFHQSSVTELIYTPERTNLNDKFNYFSCSPHPKARAASTMAVPVRSG